MTLGEILRAEGREEGKIEAKEEVAMVTLDQGATAEYIAKVTGLTLEKIGELER